MRREPTTVKLTNAEPGTPEYEQELCRRDYNAAGQRVMAAQKALGEAIQELSDAAVRLGRADEATRHGGYGPEPAG